MFYRSSLTFVTLHWFLVKSHTFDLVNFSDQTVFRTFFSIRLQILTWFFGIEVGHHVLQTEFDFRYAPSIFGKVRDLGLSKFQWSNSFPHFFSVCLQILSWFLACKSINMTYRSSLTFFMLHWFLAKLRTLDLVNFSDQTVFCTFFLNACTYWADFWRVSQSSWLTDQVGVSLHLIDFSRNYVP